MPTAEGPLRAVAVNVSRSPAVNLGTESRSRIVSFGEAGETASNSEAPLVNADPVSWSRRGRCLRWIQRGLRGSTAAVFSVSRSGTDGGPGESLRIGPKRLILSVSRFGAAGCLTQIEHTGARVRRNTN
jgi:hypothetical protein